jgi:hypothetical protein
MGSFDYYIIRNLVFYGDIVTTVESMTLWWLGWRENKFLRRFHGRTFWKTATSRRR